MATNEAVAQAAADIDLNGPAHEPSSALDTAPSTAAECIVTLTVSSPNNTTASTKKNKKCDDDKGDDDTAIDQDDIRALLPLTYAKLADMEISQAVDAAQAEFHAVQDKASERTAASAGRGMLPFLGLGSRKASARPSAEAAGAIKASKKSKKKKAKAAASPVAHSPTSPGSIKASKGRLLRRLFSRKAADSPSKAAASKEAPIVEIVLTPPPTQAMERKANKSSFKLGSVFKSRKGTSSVPTTPSVIPEGAAPVPALQLVLAEGCVTSSAALVLPALKVEAARAPGLCSKGIARLSKPFKALFKPAAAKLQLNEM